VVHQGLSEPALNTFPKLSMCKADFCALFCIKFVIIVGGFTLDKVSLRLPRIARASAPIFRRIAAYFSTILLRT